MDEDVLVGAAAAGWSVYLTICIAIVVIAIIAMVKVYSKAGKPGWACIVPIYNIIVFLQIVGKPWWWIFMYCIPVVNIVFLIWTMNMLSKSFGKTEGFTVGLLLLSFIFLLILAFGDAKYQGPFGGIKGDWKPKSIE